MGSLVAVCVICLTMIYVTCEESPFTDSDLRFVVNAHDVFCGDNFRCGKSFVNETTSSTFLERLGVTPPPVLYEDYGCCENLCSCDIERCQIDRSCCPDAFNAIPTVDDSKDKQKIFCDYPQLKPYRAFDTSADYAYTMFQKCPNGDMPFDTISKCEERDKYDDLDTKIPVTDTRVARIYGNRYCAYCHGAMDADLVYWDINVICNKGETLIPSDTDHVVRDVMESSNCNLVAKIPQEFWRSKDKLTCTKTIETCNETGHWATYDPVIEAACHAYGGMYSFRYKNVYCYLCNTKDTIGLHPYDCGAPQTTPFVTFSALLKFTPNKDSSTIVEERWNLDNACGINQIFDSVTDTCRNISCLAPKTFRNGSCHNTIAHLGGVDYTTFLKMTPTLDIPSTDLVNTVADIENYTADFLSQINVFDMQSDFSIFYKISNSPDASAVDYFVVYFTLLSPLYAPIPLSSIDQILTMDGNNQTITTQEGQTREFLTELEVYDKCHSYKSNRKDLFIGQGNITLEDRHTVVKRPLHPPQVPTTRLLTRQTNCPLITIGIDEFTVSIQTWEITIHELKTQLNRNEYILTGENDNLRIQVCVDTYQRMLLAVENLQNDGITSRDRVLNQFPAAVLSVVCTSVSVVCALLVLLTYSLFPEMRTQPGINNMCLMVSLITAQVLFQFGSGQADHISKLSCQIIGILVHFSWLMVVFWMNVCSYHMYTVFNSNFVALSKSSLSTPKYCLYSSVMSAIFVAINIVVVFVDSNGNDIGYGGSSCYISRSAMVGYVFALPVGLVILSNLVMFAVVISKLAKAPNLETNSKTNRNLFVIYAKISTLTGIAWLFGFVYHFYGIVAIEYIFIILNAGQGVFVFLSFVCNRRIARLYLALISPSHTDMTGYQGTDQVTRLGTIKDSAITKSSIECSM